MIQEFASSRLRAARLCLLAGLGLIASSCQAPDFRRGDLPALRHAGELRVIVRPGFPDPGPEAVLLRYLACRLGLGLRWVRPARHDQLLPWLREGRGDLAVARFSPWGLLAVAGVARTTGVAVVEDLVVAGPRLPVPGSDQPGHAPLESGQLHLQASAAWWLPAGPRFVALPEEVPFEVILDRVAAGRYPMTLADSGLIGESVEAGKLRVLDSLGSRPLVWAVRQQDSQLLGAVNRILLTRQVLVPSPARYRDLDQIRQAGVLRLITRDSPTTCRVVDGAVTGFECRLARALCQALDVELAISFPPCGVDPAQWLAQGHGDLLALHEPLPPRPDERLLVCSGYRMVDLVSLARADLPELHDLARVATRSRLVVAASPPVATLLGLPPPPWQALWAGSEQALEQVVRGAAEVAVVDSDLARMTAARGDLAEGPVLLPQLPLGWLINRSAPDLFRAACDFLEQAKTNGLLRQLALMELKPDTAPLAQTISPFDELLQAAARPTGLDWRLLAALMYQESRFDPKAVGPGGSAGLFQFMPRTWRELRVNDPHDPVEAVAATIEYFAGLMERFSDAPMPDRTAMALASFNVGPRHVENARSLAADPLRWSDSVEVALREEAGRTKNSRRRCRRAVRYTRQVLNRYRVYAQLYPPR